MTSLTNIADFLAEAIVSVNAGQRFVLMSKTHGNGLPLVAWRLKFPEHFDGRNSFLYLSINLDSNNPNSHA